VFSTGFACLRAGLKDNNLKYFNRIVPELRGIRRYGSAAIDMAFVAAGRLDGFWEMQLNLYDIAAGILLVKEAGGNVCDFQGGRNYPLKGTVTTNGLVDGQFLPLLKD
jgi:myo-inositol-1(or 4)-monophosphatase